MPLGNFTDTLASTYGISPSWFGAMIGLTSVMFIQLAMWKFTGSLRVAWVFSMAAVIGLVWTGLIPAWVAVVYGVMGGAFVMLPVFLGGMAGEQEEGNMVSSKKLKATVKEIEGYKKAQKDLNNFFDKIQNKDSQKELTLRVEKSSQKWAEYHNNLDGLLGITTSNGMTLAGLNLTVINELLIQQDYDWYITDKIPDQDIFKIVGLHKKDSSKNLVYLLGKNKETGQPFLSAISSSHLEDDMGKCLDAKEEKETNGLMVGLMMSAIGSAMLPSLIKGIVDGVDTKGGKR